MSPKLKSRRLSPEEFAKYQATLKVKKEVKERKANRSPNYRKKNKATPLALFDLKLKKKIAKKEKSRKKNVPKAFLYSGGSDRIESFLARHNITYLKEKTFPDLKYTSKLKFDFYLTKHNLAIEYNGQQHYYAIDYWGGDLALAETKIRDKIKIQYCLEKGIRLLIIPYSEFARIEDILSETLGS
jgi:hypothetical protein